VRLAQRCLAGWTSKLTSPVLRILYTETVSLSKTDTVMQDRTSTRMHTHMHTRTRTLARTLAAF
jgi:hypothetical protein